MRLCHSDTSSLNEIAQVIQLDPALSSEVLKFANSSFFDTGIQVASIQKATIKLGMKTVVNLALSLSLLSANKSGKCRDSTDSFIAFFYSRLFLTINNPKVVRKHF